MAEVERQMRTKDEHYDLVSVLYHALQGGEICSTYLHDAEQAGDQELSQFFREAQEHYRTMATRAKQLLKKKLPV